jgi:hypothetical protein
LPDGAIEYCACIKKRTAGAVTTPGFIALYLPQETSGITMKRVTVNALVDTGCLVTFIPSLLTGLVLFLFLPQGGGRGSGWATYLGITRSVWVDLHNYTSLAFAVLLIVHLLLHWRFFRNIGKAFRTGGDESIRASE